MADEDPDVVQVRFLADSFYENEGRGRGTHFKAGKVYEMSEEHAQRWIRRNVAELVDEPPDPFPEVENAKPRRGRPPKDRSADDDGGDSKTEQAQPAPSAPSAPSTSPAPSAQSPAPQPPKAPDKVR